MGEIPIAPFERIIRESGAERVSQDASQELTNYLENTSHAVAKKAVNYANYAGRKTVRGEDVALALKLVTVQFRSDKKAEPGEKTVFIAYGGVRSDKKAEARGKDEIPIAPFERIIRKSGAERVGVNAGLELGNISADLGKAIAIAAVKNARIDKRKTVKVKDIKKAIRAMGPGPFGP